MASQSRKTYIERGKLHQHTVAKKLFEIADSKKSNPVISADLEDTDSLLKCADDRKLVDIGNTVQKQYHNGALRISEWADIVNLSILGGEGIVQALTQTVTDPNFPFSGQRAFLILAEMTSKGSLATGPYTQQCIAAARKYPHSTIGFVATQALATAQDESATSQEDPGGVHHRDQYEEQRR
ncbi:Orotidine 5'-phosphate decarboxylase [Cordyceps fumosorosea ARSEF 2679]|uniref:Orotidine 5'-phosphate decarboxylase n=1 Tax=Cordyceps fumosorosea (strain ARSEF 2679) TaxID=1081104 RepID=A0A167WJR1_CORFA|nr:Orotidine 5'-phosphate decarboxylase [Cordyceps fumosorosea ARSEF 2679]OAA63878.1 Orotidine 5'-phosphate decarboxylase [Cordyceps fumosorosea ARSEF 2679]